MLLVVTLTTKNIEIYSPLLMKKSKQAYYDKYFERN